MNLNIQEREIPIYSVFNYNEGRIDMEYPAQDDDKCNLHILSKITSQKSQNKKKERVKKPLEAGQLVGHWNNLEKKKYHWFLQMHHGHFENKQLRRMDKIFKSMATFIGTRAADQCRSHHQKMEKKYKTFHFIIYNLRINHYDSLQVQDMVQQFTSLGIVSPNPLIDPFPLDNLIMQAKIQMQQVKEQECFQNLIHYNFFAERECDFVQPAFSGMTP